MKHGSLFSGIGGFDLAAEWMGWENVFHCEIEAFPRKVLNYYWPNSISYEDIKTTDFSVHRNQIDILTGGFPCQPYSTAGNRLGKNDERHLWPEMLRAIQSIQPRWIVGENVRGLVSWSDGLVFEEVQTDLETEGYEVQAFLLPAAGVNAPHRRDRIWFVAKNTNSSGFVQRKSEEKGTEIWEQRDIGSGDSEWIHRKKGTNASNTDSKMLEHGYGKRKAAKSTEQKKRAESFNGTRGWETFPIESPICGGDDEFPIKLDGITFPKWRNGSIKGYGNAVVPALVYEIFKSIEEYESLK